MSLAKIGRSAIAPPKNTAKRSSDIEPRRTGLRRTNRIPAAMLWSIVSPSPSARSGIGLRLMNRKKAVDSARTTAMARYVVATPRIAIAIPPIAGPRIPPVVPTELA